MKRLTIGIVDYGIGNHTSVKQALRELDFRCRVGNSAQMLETSDLLVLPGVGAYRPAMQALRARALDRFVIEWANRKRPVLGICLGMQLLAQSSSEDGHTAGLGLIPGEVVSLAGDKQWHIGWNTLDRADRMDDDPLFLSSYGQAFYFNHSYVYRGPEDFQVGRTCLRENFAAAVRREHIVGVQFHPEKSQLAGQALLRQLVQGLCNA